MKSCCFTPLRGFTVLLLVVFGASLGFAQVQNFVPTHLAPSNWWVGMRHHDIEVIVHERGIASAQANIVGHWRGVRIDSVAHDASPNYLYLYLHIADNAAVGDVPIGITIGNQHRVFKFPLLARTGKQPLGLTSADVMYLLMPDRFSNGDAANDVVSTCAYRHVARDSGYARHGGDLQGVINHLDYLQKLGVTALWMTPVQANDMPTQSYHGYAMTDHYTIDPRLGTVAKYEELVAKTHEGKMKIVTDLVHNHIGDRHWLWTDRPSEAWFHGSSDKIRTTYRATTLFDPYGSEAERKVFSDGWFDTHMPDVNQRNRHVARYFIQNNLWWVERFGTDAYRVDTYAYPDNEFMQNWVDAMLEEYPTLGIFGETWVQGVLVQAYFTKNHITRAKQVSSAAVDGSSRVAREESTGKLPGVTDFQLYYALTEGVTKPMGWTEGIQAMYHTLAVDYVYEDAYKNVVFLDNHDLSRFYSVVGENLDKYKQGVAMLLTTRGIPCIYYGTEVLMKNFASLSGVEAREDFAGGWAGDKVNKFEASGRTERENEAFNFVSTVLAFRKSSAALKGGKLMQFVPSEGVYTYFRYTVGEQPETVMVVVNTDKGEKSIPFEAFAERTKGYASATDILTGEVFDTRNPCKVKAGGVLVLSLKRAGDVRH